MSLLRAQMKSSTYRPDSVKGVPMTPTVGPCGLWYNMLFPCTLTGNCFSEYLHVESPCGRLVSVEAACDSPAAEIRTKNTFYDYMKATGELYYGDTGKLYWWS